MLPMPVTTAEWKTLQIVFTSLSDGTLASFSGIDLNITSGHLWVDKGAHSLEIAALRSSINDIQILIHHDSLAVYVNGKRAVASIRKTTSAYPTELGLGNWHGGIYAYAGYDRELTASEMATNQGAGIALARAMIQGAAPKPLVGKDTPTVTVEADLNAFPRVRPLTWTASSPIAAHWSQTNTRSSRSSPVIVQVSSQA